MERVLNISTSLQSVRYLSSEDSISIDSSVESFDEAYTRILELKHVRQPEPALVDTLPNAFSADMKAQRPEIDTQSTEINNQNAEINAASVDINAQNADINAPGAEIYAQSAEINAQSADINTQSADINTQSADISTRNVEVNSVSAQINTSNTQINISEDILSQALNRVLRPTQIEQNEEAVTDTLKYCQKINTCLTAKSKMIFIGLCMILVISLSTILVILSTSSAAPSNAQRNGSVCATGESCMDKNDCPDYRRFLINKRKNETQRLKGKICSMDPERLCCKVTKNRRCMTELANDFPLYFPQAYEMWSVLCGEQ